MEKDHSLEYKKVMVPFDGSVGAAKALRKALSLASDLGAELTVFSVDEHLPRHAPGVGEVEESEQLREAYFDELRAKAHSLARKQGVAITFETEVGHAAQSILRYAQEHHVGLIVIGHSGRSGVWGTLLGSTTARVVDQALCDVLVVR